MTGNLYDLYVSAIRSAAGKLQACSGQDCLIFAVKFIAVAMALADFGLAIDARGKAVGFELAGPRAQAHGATQFVNAAQLAQLIDNAVRRAGVKFTGIRFFQPTDVASRFNAGGLHSQADPEIRDLLLTGIADGVQHTVNTAFAKAAGHQNAVKAFKLQFVIAGAVVFSFQALSLYPGN